MKSPNFSFPARRLGVCLAGPMLSVAMSVTAVADHNTPEALEARTAPEGQLNVVAGGAAVVAATVVAATAGAAQDGETVYNTTCVACHGAGIAGAPKTGDAEIWQERIARGMAELVANAIDGFQGATGVMLPKGGNAALSDDEVRAAVEYMVEQSR